MNRAMLGAKRKGFKARKAGEARVSPYGDHRTWFGGVTFSRAFSRCWLEGWDEANKGEEKGGTPYPAGRENGKDS